MKKRTSFKVRKEEATKHMTVSNPRPKLQIDPHAADLIAFAGVEFICFEYDPTITVNLVRRDLPRGTAILYYNEAYPVLQEGVCQAASGQRAKLHYPRVPDGLDWISVDYYRTPSHHHHRLA